MKRIRAKFSSNEWDFSPCEPKELRWCFYYEHFRESKAVRDLFRRYGRRSRSPLKSHVIELLEELDHLVTFSEEDLFYPEDEIVGEPVRPLVFLTSLLKIPDFPLKPWLEIPKSKRASIIEKHNAGIKGLVQIQFEVMPEQLERMAQLRRENADATRETIAIVPFPVGLIPAEIVEAFKEQTARFARKNRRNFKVLEGGRGGFRDKLNNLGAFRVLRRMPVEKAGRYTKANSRDKRALYSSEREFLRAEKRAKRVLRHLLNSGILV